jgi:hypothetical protein
LRVVIESTGDQSSVHRQGKGRIVDEACLRRAIGDEPGDAIGFDFSLKVLRQIGLRLNVESRRDGERRCNDSEESRDPDHGKEYEAIPVVSIRHNDSA